MIRRSAIALLVILGGVVADPERDVVVRKDGTTCRGYIVEEDDEGVVVQIVVEGAKGETTVAGRITIPRSEIKEIRRASDDQREKGIARAEAFEDREWERQKRRERIAVVPMQVAGRPGLRAVGDLFDVRTTCDEEFARDACDALQQAYEGYLRHFKLRRRARRKLPVILLHGRAQYNQYLIGKYGGTVLNPAFYDTKENAIVAFNFVQEAEAARLNQETRERRELIERYREEAKALEKKIDAGATKARKEIRAEARKARNEVRRADPVNRPGLIRKINDWEQDELKRVYRWKMDEREKLADWRKKADAAVQEAWNVIRHNNKVLREQNRVMFETLFHECFHAFARNRLFTKQEIPRWLNEGMASYFEMSVVEDGDLIHGASNPWLLKLYREQAGRRRLPRIETVLRGGGEMFVVHHEGQMERSHGSYAVSWALAHYLSTRMTPDQMDAYVNDVAGGADGAHALAKALGEPLPKIDAAVRAHVETLR